MQGVSVALPAYRDSGTLERAFRAIAEQTHRDIEILLILNGADEATGSAGRELAALEPRARVLTRDDANLSAALNLALREARFELVARMDADDWCPPERLAVQAEAMAARAGVAALGTAWRVVRETGGREVVKLMRPPCEPGELRWRLLLGNVLAHGSMMLRRRDVLAVGGYDESLAKAQDFDLWLRLSARNQVACLGDCLYDRTIGETDDPETPSAAQAEVVARALLQQWESLPSGWDETTKRAMASMLSGGACDIERTLVDARPTREGLIARLWAHWLTPAAPTRAIEAGRRSRLREIGGMLRQQGVLSVWLWGAGEHTRWLLDHQADIQLHIAGIVDDARAGEHHFGFKVQSPGALRGGDHVLLSSDWHEDAMWASSAIHRERGVHVWRFYAADLASEAVA